MADADEITTPAEAKHTLVKLVQELHRVLSALRGMDAPVHDFTLDAMQETIGDRVVKDLKNFTASYNRQIAKRDELTVLINALTVLCFPLLSPTPTPFFSSRSSTPFRQEYPNRGIADAARRSDQRPHSRARPTHRDNPGISSRCSSSFGGKGCSAAGSAGSNVEADANASAAVILTAGQVIKSRGARVA